VKTFDNLNNSLAQKKAVLVMSTHDQSINSLADKKEMPCGRLFQRVVSARLSLSPNLITVSLTLHTHTHTHKTANTGNSYVGAAINRHDGHE